LSGWKKIKYGNRRDVPQRAGRGWSKRRRLGSDGEQYNYYIVLKVYHLPAVSYIHK